MTYIRRCIKCFQPWDGGGSVTCAHCRQIEAINEQTEALKRSQDTARYSAPTYDYYTGREYTEEESAELRRQVAALSASNVQKSKIEILILILIFIALPWVLGFVWRFIWGL